MLNRVQYTLKLIHGSTPADLLFTDTRQVFSYTRRAASPVQTDLVATLITLRGPDSLGQGVIAYTLARCRFGLALTLVPFLVSVW
jgi:hypothetical protein